MIADKLEQINTKNGNHISYLENIKTELTNSRLIASVYADWEVIPHLKLRGQVGVDLSNTRESNYNVGISSGLFRNRFNVTFDAYYRKTSDLLLNVPIEQVTRWTPTNTNTTIEAASNDLTVVADSRYVEGASYLRVRNIQVGYTFPASRITKDAKARLFLSLQNFFTFTSYSGYDPEASRNGMDEHSALYQGVDMATYPMAKTVQLGVQITL